MPSVALNVLIRLLTGLFSSISDTLVNIGVFLWDLGLAGYNAFAPHLLENRVVPDGHPGAKGIWPQYNPPQESDSRSACPALNALANHGVLPRDGKVISFRELSATVRTSYNFAPSFCFFVPRYIAQILGRDYWTDTFDLADISVHNGIEHDASLLREDSFHASDQGVAARALVEEVLSTGSGPNGDLTPADLSRLLGKRRMHARKANSQFTLSTFHKIFSSSNASTLLTIYGGRVEDLRPILLEERIPDGWQSRVRTAMGLTLAEFNKTVMQVEFGIEEEVDEALGWWAKWFGAGSAAGNAKGKKAA